MTITEMCSLIPLPGQWIEQIQRLTRWSSLAISYWNESDRFEKIIVLVMCLTRPSSLQDRLNIVVFFPSDIRHLDLVITWLFSLLKAKCSVMPYDVLPPRCLNGCWCTAKVDPVVFQEGIEILAVSSCYRKWFKLRSTLMVQLCNSSCPYVSSKES